MSLYLEHFSLRELPFRITPAVSFFYRGCVRGETLDAIKYAIGNGEGIITVIGEVGTGKSMLCRVLMTDLASEVELVYIANPSLTHTDIIFHIAEELGLDVDSERHSVSRELQRHLLELHNRERRVVVCIDEAQAMPDDSLEQIRLLSNLETATEKVVQIIMFGQPELESKLRQRHLRQLRERITSSFFLRMLSRDEVGEYIQHRLRSATDGPVRELMTTGAINAIARISQGIARRINILCDKAMLAAFADDSATITGSHIKKAAHDARYRRMEELEDSASSRLRNPRNWWAAAAACVAIAAIAYQAMQPEPGAEATAVAAASQPAADATKTVSVLSVNPPASTVTVQVATPAPGAPQATAVTVVQPVIARATQQVPGTATSGARPPAVRPARQRPTGEPATASGGGVPADAEIATHDNQRWQAFPPSSYLRLRLNATQTEFGQAGAAEQYTARILTVPRGNAIETERYLRDLARFFSIRNMLVYPTVAEGKEVFVVAYGVFPSEFQAELFIHELPSFFRTNKPFVQALAISRLEATRHW